VAHVKSKHAFCTNDNCKGEKTDIDDNEIKRYKYTDNDDKNLALRSIDDPALFKLWNNDIDM
jgi:hypothetical protein